MAKTQYGMGMQGAPNGMSNAELAQLLYQQQMLAGQNDSGSLGLNLQGPHPVHSIGQGIADVVGQVGGAYFDKQRANRLLALANQNADAYKQAARIATNTDLARSMDTGAPMNVSGGMATTMNPNAGQIVPNQGDNAQLAQDMGQQNNPMRYANVSLPAGMANTQPMGANERTALAMQGLNGMQTEQYGDKIAQLAREAQPPPATMLKLQPGETATPLNPVTGLPIGNPGGSFGEGLSGGPPQTEAVKNAIALGYKPGSVEFARYVSDNTKPEILRPGVKQAEIDKSLATRTTWHPATPADYTAHGLPATTRGGQVSSEGEFKPPEKQPGQTGPVYDANTGAPMGVADYQDPQVAAKLGTGEYLTHEPRPLDATTAKELADIGNTRTELQRLKGEYDPEFSRILGGDLATRAREYIGGSAYSKGTEWFNNFQATLLPRVKEIVGRNPQLLKTLDSVRPEHTDAPDVVISKMNQLMNTLDLEAKNKAATYKRGGYLGQQVDTALGFTPGAGGETAPAGGAPDPLGIRTR